MEIQGETNEAHIPRSSQLICLSPPPARLLARFADMAFLPITVRWHDALEDLLADLAEAGCDALILQVDQDAQRMLMIHQHAIGCAFYLRSRAGIPLIALAEEAGASSEITHLENLIVQLLEDGICFSPSDCRAEGILDAA